MSRVYLFCCPRGHPYESFPSSVGVVLSPLRVTETSVEVVAASVHMARLAAATGPPLGPQQVHTLRQTNDHLDEETTVLGPDDLAIVEPGRSYGTPSSTKYSVAHEGKGGLNRAIDRSRLGEAG